MQFFTGTESEYARSLVFFGFMCGLTFAMLLVTIVHMFTGDSKGKDYEQRKD